MEILKKFIELFKPKLEQGIINTIPTEPNTCDYVAISDDKFDKTHIIDISMIPVKDQSRIGSCHSHSVCMMFEHEMYKAHNVYFEMSELFHYYMVRKYISKNYPKDQGQTILDGIKCGYKYGMCPEKLSPYKIENYNKEVDGLQLSFSNLIKKKYPIKLYYRLITINDIKRAINNDNLVCCGLRVDYNFLKSKYVWTPGGSSKGGHSVVIFGYDEEYFYFRNSWGKSYGAGGNFKVKISDVMRKGFDFMSFTI